MRVPGVTEHIFQFVGTEGVLPGARRLQPGPAQEQVGRGVEDPDEGVECVIEHHQRGRGPQCDTRRPLDGKRLGSELAKHDMDKGDDRERHGEGDGGNRRRIDDAQLREDWRQPVGEERFTQPAEPEAGKRHAQLGRRQDRAEMLGGPQGQPGPHTAGLEHRPQLAGPHLYQRELGGHEKAVGEHQPDNEDRLQRYAEKITHEWRKLGPPTRRANHLPRPEVKPARSRCLKHQAFGSAAAAKAAAFWSSNSPSQRATTTLARQLPRTLTEVRAISSSASTPRMRKAPATGSLNDSSAATSTTNDARGTAATPFEVSMRISIIVICWPIPK